MLAQQVEERPSSYRVIAERIVGKVASSMAIATMKLTIESFRARVRTAGPDGAIARGHSAPIFRRLES